jgi:hypothetical protein
MEKPPKDATRGGRAVYAENLMTEVAHAVETLSRGGAVRTTCARAALKQYRDAIKAQVRPDDYVRLFSVSDDGWIG